MLHRISEEMTDPFVQTAAPPLERDAELGALGEAVAAAASGSGELVVVEAPAGLGKSRLLDETAVRAAAAGLDVLSARATELERSFPFGVALQLFRPALARLGERERAGVLAGAARLAAPLFGEAGRAANGHRPAPRGRSAERGDFSVMHGLYWLASNLADRAPLALLVDDAHWADEPSLRLFVYLAQRIDELPVALVLA
jgi:predicted ATPase